MWDEVVVQEVSVDKSAGVTQTGRDVEENDDEEVLYRGLSLGLNKNKQKEVEFCVLPSLTKRTFPPPCVMGLGPPCVVRKKK